MSVSCALSFIALKSSYTCLGSCTWPLTGFLYSPFTSSIFSLRRYFIERKVFQQFPFTYIARFYTSHSASSIRKSKGGRIQLPFQKLTALRFSVRDCKRKQDQIQIPES